MSLTVLVAGGLAVVGVAGLGAPAEPSLETPTATATPSPSPSSVPAAAIDVEVMDVDTGAVARVPVSFADAERARLTVGGEGNDYNATVTVVDGNGDGVVTVLLDTSAVGTDGAFAAADAADEVGVRSENAAAGEVPDDNYPLVLTVSGTQVDNATLLLREPFDRAATPSPTPSPTPTASPTATATASATASATPTAAGTTTPGFGAVAGALALLGTVLVGARRR